MLQHIQNIINGGDSRQQQELQGILSELTWDEKANRYVGSQRAVARITGIPVNTLRYGLGMDSRRAKNESKLLRWLAAEGIKVVEVQRQWAAGQIRDSVIAALIRYAADVQEVPTPEGKRWNALISSAGFRAAIHQMKGRGELMERASVRGRNLTQQIRACGRIQQQGKSYQRVRANMVKNVTGKVPQHLTNSALKQGIEIRKGDNWRSHADAGTLGCLSSTEETFATTGVDLGEDLRELFMKRGLWDGQVHWSQEPMSVRQAEDLGQVDRKKANRLRAAS